MPVKCNNILQVFTRDVEDRFKDCISTWKNAPGWNYISMYDDECESLGWKYYPRVMSKVTGMETNIQKLDAYRYMLLHRFGGIYADIDSILQGDLNSIITDDINYMFKENPQDIVMSVPTELIANSIIYCPAKSKLMRMTLHNLCNNKHPTKGVFDVILSTGPGLLTIMTERYKKLYPDDIAILEHHHFEHDSVEIRREQFRSGKIDTPSVSTGIHFSVGMWLNNEHS